MRGLSFSDKLSWRIIAIVLTFSIVAQTVTAFVVTDGSISPLDWWRQSPRLLIYLTAIGLASFVMIYFVSRDAINRMTRNEEKLKATKEAAERMESDLNLARIIQMSMLRKDFPPFLYAYLNPAKEVGGDLYDFNQKGDQLYFAIGDVSGKGLPASLVMAITGATLHVVADMNLSMGETLKRINDSFSATNTTGMFVTLFVARIDLNTGRMDYCNAGHCPLLVIPPDAEPYLLKSKPNLATGMFENFAYEEESVGFKQGTRIVAYTDGVTEAERTDQSQFGKERLLEWAKHIDFQTTEQSIVESLCQSVCDFTDGNPQNDDITIISIKIPTNVETSLVGRTDNSQAVSPPA